MKVAQYKRKGNEELKVTNADEIEAYYRYPDFQKFRKGAKLGLSISYPRSSNQKDLISYR